MPRATPRPAPRVAGAVTVLSAAGMARHDRRVEARLLAAAQALLAADLDGFAARCDQSRITALGQAIEDRTAAAAPGEILWLGDRAGTRLAGTRLAGTRLAGTGAGWPAGLAPAGNGFGLDAARMFDEGGARRLGVARVRPGGVSLLVARSLAPVDATRAAAVAELCPAAAEEAGTVLETAGAPGCTVLGDGTRIGQILANLFDKAVQ